VMGWNVVTSDASARIGYPAPTTRAADATAVDATSPIAPLRLTGNWSAASPTAWVNGSTCGQGLAGGPHRTG